MDIVSLFEGARAEGLFTDYDVCVQGSFRLHASGGYYHDEGARLFDIASLTKACTHLLLLKYFAEGKLSPEDSYNRFLAVPQQGNDDRKLWHFLCYVVKSYALDYEALRDGTTPCFREELLSKGFGHWGKRFQYDNLASAYLALLVERIRGTCLEQVLHQDLLDNCSGSVNLLFHPVYSKRRSANLIVPTMQDETLRGLVHDPLSRCYQHADFSVAGLFSDAETLAEMFHEGIDRVIAARFYDKVSENQLPKLGIHDSEYGLGFDIPFQNSLAGLNVDGPLVFAGWTGCRVFFAKRPRVTVCFLTNRVFSEDSGESRRRFTQFSWQVIREVIKRA